MDLLPTTESSLKNAERRRAMIPFPAKTTAVLTGNGSPRRFHKPNKILEKQNPGPAESGTVGASGRTR
jgi:hypothetical protein